MKNTSLQEIAKVINQAERITLVGHRKPDGDTLGACLAFYHALSAIGKQVTLACIDKPSRRFDFLPAIKKFQKNFLYHAQDLIIISDAGDSKMTGFQEFIPEFLSNEVPILNVDHHISNNYFGTYNFVDTASASATMIVYEILAHMGFDITPEIATALLTGIYNDTGGFMHSNTTLRVFNVAAKLAVHGASGPEIARHLLLEKPVAQLRTWGLALSRLKTNAKNIASSVLTLEDIKQCGASAEETGGVIDLLNTLAGAQFTVLLAEDEKGFVKGSFRTQKDDVDVAEIASQFGGGGHKKAAGFRVPGRLQRETIWKITHEPVE